MSSDGVKSTSLPILVTAVTAVLAVFGLQLGRPSQQQSSHVHVAEGTTADKATDEDGELRNGNFYDPFRRFLGKRLNVTSLDTQMVDELLVEKLQDFNAQYLIACLPDPNDTRAGYRFDMWLEALQRAAEIHPYLRESSDPKTEAVSNPTGFILDQFYLPWDSQKHNASKDGKSKNFGHRDVPGVLLFRCSYPKDEPIKLLIIFLIGDSPTAGVQKESFRRALKFVMKDLLNRQQHAPEPISTASEKDRLSSVRIIGPVYSGSEPSLQMVIQDAFEHELKQPIPLQRLDFQAFSTATALALDEFNCPREGKTNKFGILRGGNRRFLNEGESTVCEGESTVSPKSSRKIQWTANLISTCISDRIALQALLDYVKRQHRPNAPKIAILHESNTGFGAQLNPKLHITDTIWAPFPAHINRIASARKLLTADDRQSSPQIPTSKKSLQIPDDTDEGVTDMIPLRKPAMTTVVQEFALMQLLNHFKTDRVQYVVISATDPRDKLYLAEMLNEYCPDAQILLTMGDLLYTHPSYFPFLGGALVASPYPLSNKARDWGIADSLSTQIVFPDYAAQAYFNAVLLSLGKNEHLMDYQTPAAFHHDPTESENARDSTLRPGLWISQVASRHFRPVRFIPYNELIQREYENNELIQREYENSVKTEKDDPYTAAIGVGLAFQGKSVKLPSSILRPQIPQSLPAEWVIFCGANILAFYYFGWQTQYGIKLFKKRIRHPLRPGLDFSDIVANSLANTSSAIPRCVLSLMIAICVAQSLLIVFANFLLWRSVTGNRHELFQILMTVCAFCVSLYLTWIFGCCLAESFKSLARIRKRNVLFIGLGIVLWTTVASLYYLSNRSTGAFNTLGDVRMRAWQLTDVLGGASPMTACTLLSCLWIAGGYTILKCRMLVADEKSVNFHAAELVKKLDPADPGTAWFEKILRDGARAFRALSSFYAEFGRANHSKAQWSKIMRSRIPHVLLLTLGAIFLVEPLRDWKPVFDWPILSQYIRISFALGVLFVLWQTVEILRLWKLCSRLHREIAKLPFQTIWSRLPDGIIRDYMTGLSPIRVRHVVPKYAQQQFTRLESLVAATSPPIAGIDLATLHETAQLEKGLLTKPGLWSMGVLSVRLMASGTWKSRNALVAFDGLPPSAAVSKADAKTPRDQIEDALEDFLAVVIVLFLSRYQLHLKQRAYFLLAAPILLLAAMTAYPFQPGVRIVYVIGFVALSVSVGLSFVLTNMNRDPLLSHMSGSKPQFFSFDLDFLGPMLLFVGPLVVIVLGQLPVVGPFLQSLLSPLVHAVSS